MKRSTFLSTIAASLAVFFGFKKKPKSSYYLSDVLKNSPSKGLAHTITKGTHTYSNQSGDTWTDQGLFVQEGGIGYTNEATIIKIPSHDKIEFTSIDWDRRKYVVQRSEDSGQTWTTVREYDLENLRA